jgi:hypothetical protein
MVVIFGYVGSDAGFTYIDSTGIHHSGGGNRDSAVEFDHAISILKTACKMKSPELARAVVQSVWPFAEQQIKEHFKGGEGAVFVAGAS